MSAEQKAIGIVCEYNPFHNGHAAQLRILRARFPDKPIVSVMSGNFTQRGSAAVADCYTRAQAALLCGADLILELPFPHCCFGAKDYAASAVSVLERLGCVDTLAFGVRGLDADRLRRLADILRSQAFEEKLREDLKRADKHSAYAYVRERTLLYFAPDSEGLLRDPNNILALEYAARNAAFALCPVERQGEDHASQLRRILKEGGAIDAFVPEQVARLYRVAAAKGRFAADTDALDAALLAHLRLHGGGAFLELLGERVRNCALRAADLEDFLERAKTSRVPKARIRRGALLEYLGAVPEDIKTLPLYSVVLGASERGRALLAHLRKTSAIPLYAKPAMLKRLTDPAATRAVRLKANADAIYASLIGVSGDWFWKQQPNCEQIVNFSKES